MRTPLARRVSEHPALADWVAAKQPLLGGLLEPSDAGGLIAFLCGDGSRAITAQTIAVDAGWQLD
ncbi:SDR family oxidoreductase [Jiangella rhizosphaerae]|uniref:SDR family oxidoreductase n=1 Tax=Jiangella rhizosphaerae TaxID=2293569 RepID=UPI001314E71F|nr:SDR family oxidoreductase [Jiangella rhizosphaerae]